MDNDTKPHNPLAFPSTHTVTTATGIKMEDHYPGMTLRDYFAGKALAGMLADPTIGSEEYDDDADRLASAAYTYADAMLKARGP